MHPPHHLRIAALAVSIALMFLVGCSCGSPMPVPEADSGTADAGSSPDGGIRDAGASPDGGDEVDSGPLDAGSMHNDAGMLDAGVGTDDAGTDGGTHVEACIWEDGGTAPLGSGLHFNLTWSTADNDLDLRVTRPGYDLCADGTNGRDVDDTNGYGPENIPVVNPDDGVYTAWVHFFEGSSASATISVFAEGADTLIATCTLPLVEHQLWQAVAVTVTGSTVTLTEPGSVTDDFSCNGTP